MAPEHSEKVDNMVGRAFGTCVIDEKIAIGGFGTVYKATDSKLAIPRAIKIFHPHLSEEKGFRKRFDIEMRMLAHLDHPNIVRIVNAIDEPDSSGFIMEYVEGETLSDIVENQGALSISESLDIFAQVARSIAYAHNLKHQIIHRDLSPDNIMIRPDKIVKIMDFGIAKTIGSERVTQTGIVLGKPTYMAPEQFEGTVSIYTDQYALGVILYEMITGRVPFDAESPIALYKLHLNEPPVPPTEINDKIPNNVENVILKALAKDEKDRFDNVDQMLDALLSKDQQGIAIDNRIPSLMLDVEDAVKNEEFDAALQLIKEVLQYDPENREAISKREEVSRLQKKYQDQDMIEEWFHQALAFKESSMDEESCQAIVDFLKLAVQYPKSRTIKRYYNTLQRKMPEVFAKAKSMMEDDWKKMEEYTRNGKSLFQQDKFIESLKCFEKAIQIAPYNPKLQKLKVLTQKKIRMSQVAAYYRDGILALKNEQYEKAVEALQQVLELHPQHKTAKKHLEMAENERQKIEQSRTEVETLYCKAMEYYDKWEFPQAIEEFQKVLAIDKDHKDAKKLLDECQKRIADENKLEEIVFFYNQGLTFYKSQQWEKSITCFNRVLQCMDNHKGALEYKHLAEQNLDKHTYVEAAFQEALEFFRTSRYTDALAKLDYILSIDKNHKGARQYHNLCKELQGLADETSGLTMPDSGEELSGEVLRIPPDSQAEIAREALPNSSSSEEVSADMKVTPPKNSSGNEVNDETDEDTLA